MPSTSWLVFIGTWFNPCSQDIGLHVLFSFSWSHTHPPTQHLVPSAHYYRSLPPAHHPPLCIVSFYCSAYHWLGTKVSKRLVILLWNNWSKRNVGKTPDGSLSLFFFLVYLFFGYTPVSGSHKHGASEWLSLMAPIVRINPFIYSHKQQVHKFGSLPHLPATHNWNILSTYHVYD